MFLLTATVPTVPTVPVFQYPVMEIVSQLSRLSRFFPAKNMTPTKMRIVTLRLLQLELMTPFRVM